jgi:hypothetical protein
MPSDGYLAVSNKIADLRPAFQRDVARSSTVTSNGSALVAPLEDQRIEERCQDRRQEPDPPCDGGRASDRPSSGYPFGNDALESWCVKSPAAGGPPDNRVGIRQGDGHLDSGRRKPCRRTDRILRQRVRPGGAHPRTGRIRDAPPVRRLKTPRVDRSAALRRPAAGRCPPRSTVGTGLRSEPRAAGARPKRSTCRSHPAPLSSRAISSDTGQPSGSTSAPTMSTHAQASARPASPPRRSAASRSRPPALTASMPACRRNGVSGVQVEEGALAPE